MAPPPGAGVRLASLCLERVYRASGIPLRIAGILFWLTVIPIAVAFVAATVLLIPWIAVYWIFSLLAIRDLDFEAALVIRELRRGDLPAPDGCSRGSSGGILPISMKRKYFVRQSRPWRRT